MTPAAAALATAEGLLSFAPPDASISVPRALLCVLVESARAADRGGAWWRPAPGQGWTMQALGHEFPKSDGRPRSVRTMELWRQRGVFGTPGQSGGPFRDSGGAWRVTDAGVRLAHGEPEPNAPRTETPAAPEPARVAVLSLQERREQRRGRRAATG